MTFNPYVSVQNEPMKYQKTKNSPFQNWKITITISATAAIYPTTMPAIKAPSPRKTIYCCKQKRNFEIYIFIPAKTLRPQLIQCILRITPSVNNTAAVLIELVIHLSDILASSTKFLRAPTIQQYFFNSFCDIPKGWKTY